MCEIAVLDGQSFVENAEHNVKAVMNALYHGSNDDGFGLLSISVTEDGQFAYEGFKGPGGGMVAEESGFIEWVEEQTNCWRMVAHARLATHGGTGFAQTHPIKIVDNDVDAEFIIHNGVVRNDKSLRESLTDDGHTFNTEVDSEVIAHKYDNIPTDIDNLEQHTDIKGNLNWLLFGRDAILVQNSGKYKVTPELKMMCRPQWLTDEMRDNDIGKSFSVFTPDGEHQQADVEKRYSTGTRVNSRTTQWGRGGVKFTSRTSWTRSTGSRGSTSGSSGGFSNSKMYQTAEELAATTYSETLHPEDTVFMRAAFTTNSSGGKIGATSDTAEGLALQMYESQQLEAGIRHEAVSTEDDSALCVQMMSTEDYDTQNLDRAVVAISCVNLRREDDSSYEAIGRYTTDSSGRILLPNPGANFSIKAHVVALPGYTLLDDLMDDNDDDDENGDSDDAELATLSDEEARDVNEWQFYSNSSIHSSAAGYCLLHGTEFDDDGCEECLKLFTADQLLNRVQVDKLDALPSE